jgi:hypothetical protein
VITPVNQRWRDRRDSYRPAGEPIQTSRYEVAELPGDSAPKAFILRHHYLASYPATQFRFGLHRAGRLVGVAVFGPPANYASHAVIPADPKDCVTLSRLVLLDDVPANGETWFLARCFEALKREQVAGVVSFSDPVPRENSAGQAVFGGHIGNIYQAFNALYVGRAKARTIHLLPDGRTLDERALAKLRALHRGWRYVVKTLMAFGAPVPRSADALGAWGEEWIGRLTRKVRHPGNHKYVWALHRRIRRQLPVGLPYPKFSVAPLLTTEAAHAS